MHKASHVEQDVAGKINQDQIGKGLHSTFEFIITGGRTGAFLATQTVCGLRHLPGAYFKMGSCSSS